MDGFCLRRRGPERQIHRRTQPGSLYRHRPTSLGWGAVMAVLFTLTYALGGNAFLGLLTDDKEVIAVADTYFYWALAVPAVGIAAFIWDGIFYRCHSHTRHAAVHDCSSRQLLLSCIMAYIPSWQTMLYGLPSSPTS